MTLLYAVTFEDGYLYPNSNGVDIAMCSGGILQVTGAAKMGYGQSYGAELTPHSNYRMGIIKSVDRLKHFRHGFFFDPNSIPLTTAFTLFRDYSTNNCARLILGYSAPNYTIYMSIQEDGGSSSSGTYTMTDAPHWIEMEWAAATYAGANDGIAKLWIDDILQEAMSGLDNDMQTMTYPMLGSGYDMPSGTYSPFYVDYWTANDDGSALYKPILVHLYNVDFETNNLSQFTSTNTDGTNLDVNAAAAMKSTSYGMRVKASGTTNQRYGRLDVAATKRFRIRFYFNLSTWAMPDYEHLSMLLLYGAGGVQYCRIRLYHDTGSTYRAFIYITDDSGSETESSGYISLASGAHYIEVDYLCAANSGNNNGYANLYYDGVLAANITGIDNDTRDVEYFTIGAPFGPSAADTGIFYIDQIYANNTGDVIGA